MSCPFFSLSLSFPADITNTYSYQTVPDSTRGYYNGGNNSFFPVSSSSQADMYSSTSTTSTTGVGPMTEMCNGSLVSVSMACGRSSINQMSNNNEVLLDQTQQQQQQQQLLYLDSPMRPQSSGSNVDLYTTGGDSGLVTTAKLLSSSAALQSPISGVSPLRMTPLGSAGIGSPLLMPSQSPNSNGSGAVLPPVSTFVFPTYRSMNGGDNYNNGCDWFIGGGGSSSSLETSPLMPDHSKLVSSGTPSSTSSFGSGNNSNGMMMSSNGLSNGGDDHFYSSDLDFYGLITDYPMPNTHATTAAL